MTSRLVTLCNSFTPSELKVSPSFFPIIIIITVIIC